MADPMLWYCCGLDVTTLFCPHCGKPIEQGPIMELLRYVKGMENSANTWLETHHKNQDIINDARASHNKTRNRCKAKRWKRFGDALSALIAEANDTSRP